MKRLNSQNGVTLIETVLYLGLFTLIITSVLASVDGILEANARSQTKVMVLEEGAFILGKIDWALTGVTSASIDASGKILTTIKQDSAFPNPIQISIDSSGNVFIKRGTGADQRLNNSNVTVSCAALGCFEKTLASGDGINPESISATLTINATTSDGLSYSQDFSTIKFIRK